MKKLHYIIYVLLALPFGMKAQVFDEVFMDKTLRIDYTFSGNQEKQWIAVDEMLQSDHWYGKRHKLNEVPVEGNGQILVTRHGARIMNGGNYSEGDVLYRNSFSTLFQEWITYDEAKEKTRSFENVFLIPFPKDTVDVTVNLYNNRRDVVATMTHTVVPTDILIRKIGVDGEGKPKTTPYVVMQKPADESRCIRIALVAEGYKQEDMDEFIADAKTAIDAIFKHEPFKSLRDRFGIVAVKSPSVDSGTSEPSKGIWLNTALHSNFDTFYSDRYLTTLHIKDLHNWLSGTPYEHIIVLVNTDKYGGGGILNSYNLSMTHHPKFRPVVVHEFGHSFAGLADEYAYDFEPLEMYPLDIEPWEHNITTTVDFASKWKDMLTVKDSVKNRGAVGLYEGAGYALKGVYRPSADCRMRTNENPDFCPVCKRAITDLIKFYTEPQINSLE